MEEKEIYKILDLNNLEGEEWRDIEGYEGLYQVSSYGRVKSLRNNKGNTREKIRKQGKNNKGYLLVNLCKKGIIKKIQVHRLVAIAFIPNPNGYPTVNHNNEIKTDNRVSNLCWMDYSQQQRYGTAQQRRVASTDYKARTAHTDYKSIAAKIDYKEIGRKNAEKQRNDPNKSKQVYQYSKDGTLVAIYPSVAECGRNGFDQGAVSACCRGKLKHYKGYNFSYTEL